MSPPPRKIFRVFDLDGDGFITIGEMNTIIKVICQPLSLFANIPLEYNRQICYEMKDMYGLLKTENPELEEKTLLSASAFKEMDKDQDGKITQEEFVSACLGQEVISRLLALKIIDIFCEEDVK